MTDELIEAVAKAIAAVEYGDGNDQPFEPFKAHARAAIRVIAPAVLEQASEACLSTYSSDGHAAGDWPTPEQCVEAIRALKEGYSHDQ